MAGKLCEIFTDLSPHVQPPAANGVSNISLEVTSEAFAFAVREVCFLFVRRPKNDDQGIVTTNVFTLQARDVNDIPELRPKQFVVNETIDDFNGTTGLFVGVLEATDKDECQNLSYSVFGDAASFFQVEPIVLPLPQSCPGPITRTSRLLLVVPALDFEGAAALGGRLNLGVRVEDDGMLRDVDRTYVKFASSSATTTDSVRVELIILDQAVSVAAAVLSRALYAISFVVPVVIITMIAATVAVQPTLPGRTGGAQHSNRQPLWADHRRR